jgi:hypothetical protein
METVGVRFLCFYHFWMMFRSFHMFTSSL